MHKILRWLLVLSTLIMTNLQGQEIDFANRFSLDKFNKRINKDIDHQIRRKGYREMKSEGIERYFIYNLSQNIRATWESLRDYSFLDSCSLDGRLIETFQETSLQTTIDISGLNAGMYIMKIRMADGKEYTEHIVKE